MRYRSQSMSSSTCRDHKTSSAFQVAVSWWDAVLAQWTEDFAAQRISHLVCFWIHQKRRSKENPNSMISLVKKKTKHKRTVLSVVSVCLEQLQGAAPVRVCAKPAQLQYLNKTSSHLNSTFRRTIHFGVQIFQIERRLMSDQTRTGWIPSGINASGH